MSRHIALYGKGGVGKSSIATNLSASLAEAGHRVVLVGCSPTADSSYPLLEGIVPTTLRDYQQSPGTINPASLITAGYRGVGCVEMGDFQSDCHCSSHCIAAAILRLHELRVLQDYDPGFTIFDLPGDIGCSGGATLKDLVLDIQTALFVTSADFQSMFTANRFASLLVGNRPATVALIANGNASSFEDSLVADYAQQVGLPLAAAIPRSLVVRHTELYGKTVIEAAPLSNHAYIYRRLARLIADQVLEPTRQLRPLSAANLRQWAKSWGERLGELEFGIIQDGAGI